METTINGATYRLGKLTPFQQFHIARRLAPALWAMSESAEAVATGDAEDGVLSKFKPVADVISKMSDTDSEYILSTCLSVVQRQQGNGWAQIKPAGAAGLFAFEDITLQTMMQLTFEIIKENLGSFFAALPDS